MGEGIGLPQFAYFGGGPETMCGSLMAGIYLRGKMCEKYILYVLV